MPKELMNKKDIDRAITRMAHEIIEKNRGIRDLCLVGIQRGGVHIANRISETLREIEGLSYEEIADVMNCPIGTVRSRIFRAREAIAENLRPLLGTSEENRW